MKYWIAHADLSPPPSQSQVIIESVSANKEFSPKARMIILNAGVRAIQSTPIISTSGAFIGMVSTHFPTAYQPSSAEMAAITCLGRKTADESVRQRALESMFQHPWLQVARQLQRRANRYVK